MDDFTYKRDASVEKRKVQFCSYCGTKLDEGARFCKDCGEAIAMGVQQTCSAKREEPIPEKLSERKAVYEGYIHKCPNCGDIIDAYETVCSACGYEIRGRHTTSVVHELSLKLEKMDNPQKRDDLIRTFYIPNTKEDIYEFFILATSNIKAGGANTKAWTAKLEQAYQKAELSLNGTPEFDKLELLYKKAQSVDRINTTFWMFKCIGRWFKFVPSFIIPVLIILFCSLLCFGLFSSAEKKHNECIANLETLVEEVEELIDEGNYDAARIKASQIIDDTGWSSESEEKWNDIRESLLDTIEQKKKEETKFFK